MHRRNVWEILSLTAQDQTRGIRLKSRSLIDLYLKWMINSMMDFRLSGDQQPFDLLFEQTQGFNRQEMLAQLVFGLRILKLFSKHLQM